MGKPAPFWAVGLAAVLVAYGNQFAFSQENAADGPESSPTPATSPAVNSKKSVPAYRAPTVAEITEVLQRVHGRLNEVPVRIVVRKTRKEVTDFSEPMAGLATDPGPEGKFGQFHYGMGVIHSGMLNAFDVTGDKRFADYSVRSFQFFADHLGEFEAWQSSSAETGRNSLSTTQPVRINNPFRVLLKPGSLDDCGAMATAMIKARAIGLGPDLKSVIDRAVDYVHARQFRLPDGTLARKSPIADSVWADDMYMGVCILAQAGKMTGDSMYFDEAAKQVLQIASRLYVPEKKLMTHGWNSDNPDFHPKYYWGRANGWCMMAMAELLSVLPEDHASRPAILNTFRRLAEGIASVQAGNGLWHQMLDRTDSYTETSASAMFTFALARGVDRGWLDGSSYGPVAQAGWNGLVSRIDENGRIVGTCVGTNYANDYIYYYSRPSADDIHGYGPVLLAGSEMIRLQRTPKFRIRGPGGGLPVSFSKIK
jgi:rhamnogalacturonyl hydrolase YesR